MEENKPRYRKDKPKKCQYCFWYKSKKNPCSLKRCYYLIENETPKIHHMKGQCKGCPYGKDLPCIGYCIRKLLMEMKQPKILEQTDR